MSGPRCRRTSSLLRAAEQLVAGVGHDVELCGSYGDPALAEISSAQVLPGPRSSSAFRRGHSHRPRITVPSKPTQLQASSPNFRADEARDVIAAFTPIEARSAENSPALRFRCQFCAEG